MPVLQFKGKTAVENYHHTVPHHRLEFDAGLSVLAEDEKPGLDGNLIIEGDNLLALKALLPTHAGRIKCIYIDPPYNTGEEGWVYNDNLTQPQFREWIGQTVGKEGEDATRHDKWCCMMYPRLQLLKQLLREDGAIFVSIDDNEFHHLRLLMEEIFGAEGFVGTFVWQKRYSRDNRPALNTVHDYILVFSYDNEVFKRVRNKLPADEKSLAVYRNPNNDPRGRWRPVPMTAQGYRENQMYPITTPTGMVHEPPPGRCWSMLKSEYEKLLKEGSDEGINKRGKIWFGADGNAQPNVIRYLDEVEGFVPWTWLPHTEAGHTDEAKKEVYEILGTEEIFGTPKPVRLIRRLLEIYTDPDSNDLILDSFAGSGTTADAVLQLNSDDEGNRRFILIQQPHDTKENQETRFNICERITAERVKRVIRGYDFKGIKEEILLEEKLSLKTLRKAEELLAQIEAVKEEKSGAFDEISTESSNGTVRVIGKKIIESRAEGKRGSFTYARLGPPLFDEYRNLGNRLPDYDEIARYIFYTETSREFDPQAMNPATGKIGEHAGTSYYLLYTPNHEEDRDFNLVWLKSLEATESNRRLVVYCEKIWVHRDDLAKYEKETRRTVRAMIVPFHLK